MTQKEIRAVVKEKTREIEDLAAAVDKRFGKEHIHDFRVSVKSLRSFLRLQESTLANSGFKLSKKLKRLYRIAGVIRDCELAKEFLHEMQVNIPHYVHFLDHIVNNKKKEWEKYYSIKEVRSASKKMEAYAYKALPPDAFPKFVNDRLNALNTIKIIASDDEVHEVRKRVKDILCVSQLVDKEFWAPAQPPSELALKTLHELTDIIGDYNDERILLEHVKAFPLAGLDKEEKSTLSEFKRTERKQLQLIKKKLFEAIDRAVAGT